MKRFLTALTVSSLAIFLTVPYSAMAATGGSGAAGSANQVPQRPTAPGFNALPASAMPNGKLVLQGGVSAQPLMSNNGFVFNNNGQQMFMGPDGTITSLVPNAYFTMGGGGATGTTSAAQLDAVNIARFYSTNRWDQQIMGPMSVIQRVPGVLQPSVLATKSIMINGIPGVLTGTVLSEAPGYGIREFARVYPRKPAPVLKKKSHKHARTVSQCSK